MNDINGIRKTVRRIPTYQAEETLGVWISPNGCTKTQTEKMIEKANTWAAYMRTGVITKAETWLALNSTIWRTFCYPLNALNLSKKQCEQIMAPVINYALPAMGVCRTFPRDLVFSPTKYAGLGIKHIHTLQEIARLKDILQHTYDNTTTGKLYRTSLEYLILEIGISTDLSSIDFNLYHTLATDCLVKNTWEFLYTYNIKLEHDITIPKNMTHDSPIMYEFSTKYTSITELEALNQCRIFLRAYYVSDIATASGTKLSHHAWEGTLRLEKISRCIWPNQGAPSKQAWEIWRRALKDTILGRGMTLKKPLGQWIRRDYDMWHWYYAPTYDSLIYISESKELFVHARPTPNINNHVFSLTKTTIET
jgi:hypothetical protein